MECVEVNWLCKHMKKGSIIPELQNRVTHYDATNRVTNSKVLNFF